MMTSRGSVRSHVLMIAGESILRYGLVLLILWFGAFKFTRAEAEAIQPLLANSPLLSWVYELASIEGASRMIGSAEIAIALLIALRPVWPNLSVLGSLGAIGMFLSTLSFLFTTPGMWAWVEGILVPSAAGAFIVKDVILLGAASWTAGEALTAYRRRKTDRWAGSSVDFRQSRELAR